MVADAQQELTAEQNTASLSMFDPNNPLDLALFDGEIQTKDVAVTATVEQGGSETEQQLTVTLQRTVLAGGDGEAIEGRWVIANVS